MSIELMSLKPSFSNTYLSMNKCTNKILILLLYTLYLLTYFLNSDLFHAVIFLIWKKVFSLCDISESYIFIKACFVPIPVLILVQWDIIIMPLGKISPQNEIVMNALSPYLLYIKLQYIKICGSKKLKSFSFAQKITNHNGNEVLQILSIIIHEMFKILLHSNRCNMDVL